MAKFKESFTDGQWERWFAWRPVKIKDTIQLSVDPSVDASVNVTIDAWLEVVERRYYYLYCEKYWEYRLPVEAKKTTFIPTLIPCRCCGKMARWCSDGLDGCGAGCYDIQCDKCGMRYSLRGLEDEMDETYAKQKMLLAYNGGTNGF